MEDARLAKSHGMLLSVMEFYQVSLQNCTKFVIIEKLSIRVESPHFPQNAANAKSRREMVMEK